MAANQPDPDLECPVCYGDFQDPKLLPCTHLVCRQCVVTWLGKEGCDAGCPLCREPILASGQAANLDHQVDALPTDLAVQSAVKNLKVLNSPHICALCDGKVAASSYCLQCSIKLCRGCSKGHKRIPGFQNHAIEDLNSLTAQQLAQTCRMTCSKHPDKLVELFCSSHQELLCLLCFPSHHRGCPHVNAVADVAQEKRAELKKRAGNLLDREAILSSQMKEAGDQFRKIRKNVNDVFNDLDLHLGKRRQTVLDAVQAEEDAILASLSSVGKYRVSLKAHAETMKKLADSAANDALLGTLTKLTSRLRGLEQAMGTGQQARPRLEVNFDYQKLTGLKDSISALGEIRKRDQGKSASPAVTPTTPAAKPTRPPSAARTESTWPPGDTWTPGATNFTIGDRVKRGAGWDSGNVDGRGPGTVTREYGFHTDYRGPGTAKIIKFVGPEINWDNTGNTCRHRMSELELI